MRIAVLAAVVSLSIVGLSAADDATAAMRLDTNIPAENLGIALKSLARDRNLQILYFSDAVRDVHTGGAVGQLTTDEALTKLLSGTGLTFRYVSDKAITILPATAGSGTAGPAGAPVSSGSNPPTTSADQKEGKANASGAFLLAQAASGQAASTTAVEPQQKHTASPEVPLQQVIVTAQKRAERLMDVPAPVTSLSADALLADNEVRLQDYFTQIPGVSYAPGNSGLQFLVIRGLTTGIASSINPTVAVTVDDVPYGSSTGLGGGGYGVPDIDPSDLARIEVLRGPQGTLYGAASIGGLVKFVTVDPSTDALSGEVQAGASSVHNGATLGYAARGSINIPLNDTLAIRASAFSRVDPGYIDDPGLGVDGVNRMRVDGGRLAALWKPSENFSLKLSALVQNSKQDGDPVVQPSLGDLQQSFSLRGLVTKNDVSAYSATARAKLGDLDLVSVTGYSVNKFDNLQDWSSIFGGPTLATNSGETKKVSQELRLSSPTGARFEWLVGAFYTHEDNSPRVQSFLTVDPTTLATLATLLSGSFPTTYTEYAAFGDLTLHFNDRFDVQLGGRESWNKQISNETDTGPFSVPDPNVYPTIRLKDNSFTYLLTPRYKFSADAMAYLRVASGYRPGGPNTTPAINNAAPTFAPDKATNYEAGAKADFLDHALALDASAYYIDWKDLQVQVVGANGFAYFTNAGRAKSQGVELSIQARPTKGLTIATWAAWNDAELTEGFPSTSVFGAPGDRLPLSTHFSGNFAIDQEFPLGAGVTGNVGGALAYVGERLGRFLQPNVGGPAPRQMLPAYSRLDLHAALGYGTWSARLYVMNVTDKRAFLDGGAGTLFSNTFIVIQPRTYGLTLTKTF